MPNPLRTTVLPPWLQRLILVRVTRRTRLIFLAAGSLMMIGLYALLYFPSVMKQRRFAREIGELTQEVSGLQVRHHTLVLETVALEPAEAVGTPAPVQPQTPLTPASILERVVQLAADHGVAIQTIRPEAPPAGQTGQQPFHLEVRAPFRNLGEYLGRLERLAPRVSVEKIRIETDPNMGVELRASFEVTLISQGPS